jgi:hypothetical protein
MPKRGNKRPPANMKRFILVRPPKKHSGTM